MKYSYSYGTSHFVDRSAAVRYYQLYGCDAGEVDRKIREGEIHIGKPGLKDDERHGGLTDNGTRYQVEVWK